MEMDAESQQQAKSLLFPWWRFLLINVEGVIGWGCYEICM